MVSETDSEAACCFCGAHDAGLTFAGLRHPIKADHGPFDFYQCRNCGSGLTLAPPTRERLAALYGTFCDGLPDLQRTITADDPQNAIYSLCIRRLLRRADVAGLQIRSWIDVGAGGGELSRMIAEALPDARGLAIDLHARPATLANQKRIEWQCIDVNSERFAETVGETAQLVISTSVWEHVLRPNRFLHNLLRLLQPGGLLYLLSPDYGSLARRVLGKRWPYFTPGEHLNMPTAAGARECLTRQWQELHGAGTAPAIQCRALLLPYTLRYVFRRFGVNAVGRLLPPGLALPLPTGALESMLLAPGPAGC